MNNLSEGRWSDKTAILVWRFVDAPGELRALIMRDGDEDWLAAIPPAFYQNKEFPPTTEIPGWMESTWFDSSGYPLVCRPDANSVWAGWVIVVGSHS